MIRVVSGDYIVFRLVGCPLNHHYKAYVVEGLNWGYIRRTRKITRIVGLNGVALMLQLPGGFWMPKVIPPRDLAVISRSRVSWD